MHIVELRGKHRRGACATLEDVVCDVRTREVRLRSDVQIFQIKTCYVVTYRPTLVITVLAFVLRTGLPLQIQVKIDNSGCGSMVAKICNDRGRNTLFAGQPFSSCKTSVIKTIWNWLSIRQYVFTSTPVNQELNKTQLIPLFISIRLFIGYYNTIILGRYIYLKVNGKYLFLLFAHK